MDSPGKAPGTTPAAGAGSHPGSHNGPRNLPRRDRPGGERTADSPRGRIQRRRRETNGGAWSTQQRPRQRRRPWDSRGDATREGVLPRIPRRRRRERGDTSCTNCQKTRATEPKARRIPWVEVVHRAAALAPRAASSVGGHRDPCGGDRKTPWGLAGAAGVVP